MLNSGNAAPKEQLCTYATYFAGGGGYLKGVYALARSLQDVDSAYPLTVFASKDVSEGDLTTMQEWGIEICLLDPARIPQRIQLLNDANGFQHWNSTFDKVCLFSAVQFKKIILLDSDMIVLQNIDHLFGKPHLSAVAAGHLANPDWIDLNSGCVVIEPRERLAEEMLAVLGKLNEDSLELYKGLGDQDLVHIAYPDWPHQDDLHLSETFNLLSDNAARYIGSGILRKEEVAVVHFAYKPKPWAFTLGSWLPVLKRAIRWKSLAELEFLCRYRHLLKEASSPLDSRSS